MPFCFRVVADNPDQRIELKMFHSEFVQDLGQVRQERSAYLPVPASKTDQRKVMITYLKIKKDIKMLVDSEIGRLLNDPELAGLIISK